MRILLVAYPLLAVSEQSGGGAEQVLHTLERECARAGHATTVAAAAGSRVSGRLLETGAPAAALDALEERDREHNGRILQALAAGECAVDLVHDNGGTFWKDAARVGVPVLGTLHLPRWFYPPDVFEDMPPNLFLNCVSRSQSLWFLDLPNLVGPVRNGIAVEHFPLRPRKQGYLLWLGRICEEKGAHVAIEVAERAGMPLVLAGQVYPFSYHQRYFEEQVRPRLQDGRVRLVERPTVAEKIALLAGASALLVPSLVEETSSMVALEAMACGTPVLAFARGALPEVVVHGVTGYICDSAEEMAQRTQCLAAIDPHACRHRVEAEYSAARMAADYQRLYARVVAQAAERMQTVSA